MAKINGICVRVDCQCSRSSDYQYYPKQIEGVHCIASDDPRAKVGKYWAEGIAYCKGYSQGCQEIWYGPVCIFHPSAFRA